MSLKFERDEYGQAKSELWERTSDLRIIRNLSHIGRPERLQQAWWCRDNGKIEWRDIPVMDEPK